MEKENKLYLLTENHSRILYSYDKNKILQEAEKILNKFISRLEWEIDNKWNGHENITFFLKKHGTDFYHQFNPNLRVYEVIFDKLGKEKCEKWLYHLNKKDGKLIKN